MVENVLYESLLYTASYAMVILFGFLLMNFLSNGFLFTFLVVKASRGRKLMVKVRTPLEDYYKAGRILDNDLVFKDREKINRRITLPKEMPAIYRSMNLNFVDVDEETNTIVTKDYSIVSGHDAVKTDHLLTRALNQPVVDDKFQKIILIACIASAAASVMAVFWVMRVYSVVIKLSGVSGGVVG